MFKKAHYEGQGVLYIAPLLMKTYVYFIGNIEPIGDLAKQLNGRMTLHYGGGNDIKEALFKWHHREASEYILSTDKKAYREQHRRYGLDAHSIVDREITAGDCFYKDEDGKVVASSRLIGGNNKYPEYVNIEIVDVHCLPVFICPSTGIFWRPPGYKHNLTAKEEYTGKHLFKFKRMPLITKTQGFKKQQKIEERKAIYPAEGICIPDARRGMIAEDIKKINTFLSGDLLKSEYIEYGDLEPVKTRKKDPRWFIYSKEEPIGNNEIVQCVKKHIKKVVKIRPIKTAEKLFFQSIVGLKELTKLITKQTA
jgi:hypothetical protein